MSASTLAIIIIPIVAAVALIGWILAVFRADGHPVHKHPGQGQTGEVAGGSFYAHGGGRQLMPRPDASPHSIPSPRDSRADEPAEQPSPMAGHGPRLAARWTV